jgi:hypothetical protein
MSSLIALTILHRHPRFTLIQMQRRQSKYGNCRADNLFHSIPNKFVTERLSCP